MLRNAQGADDGIRTRLYEKGKTYKVGNSLAKAFVSGKNARYIRPRFFYRTLYWLKAKHLQARQNIRQWYVGKPYENDPSSPVVIIGMRRPNLAVKFDQLIDWFKTHWTAIIISVIATLISTAIISLFV